MLRSEIRFPADHGPQRVFAWMLGESFLGFLAIISVGLTLFPMLFDVKPAVAASVDTLQWVIIGWFAFEYVFAFASARDRSAFLVNKWRLLDLATILIPLATLLPGVTHSLRSSPILRLVRLVRLITLGVRVSGIAVRRRAVASADTPVAAPVQVTLMADAPEFSPSPASWEDL